jgi:hypothetical protein
MRIGREISRKFLHRVFVDKKRGGEQEFSIWADEWRWAYFLRRFW